MNDELRNLALKDGRFAPEAFRFLFESIDCAITLAGKQDEEGASRHVTGHEVLAGMRAHAQQLFGPLAAQVWRSWGIREPLDWGRIVFLLVEAQLLNRQESDSVDDFDERFDFDEVFVRSYSVPVDETDV